MSKMKNKNYNLIIIVLTSVVLLLSILNLLMSYLTTNHLKENDISNIYDGKLKVGYTGSMKPTFNGGEIIYYKSLCSYKVKDIVVFSRPDQEGLIVHRIINKFKTHDNIYYITKGDNNHLNDGLIPQEFVVGKIVMID